jgi:hypothetical protein
LGQLEFSDMIARAYELQEILKRERQQVRLHDEEYQKLMSQIISSKVRQVGRYEVVEKEVQKKRQIISNKFRERWPSLFNQLATVTLKDARENLEDRDLEAVCEIKITMKPVIIVRNELRNEP